MMSMACMLWEARNEFEAFWEANKQRDNVSQSSHKWSKPPVNHVKLNTNAALSKAERIARLRLKSNYRE